MARGVKGEALPYLLAHMRDGCCTAWPFAKQDGYGWVWDCGRRLGSAHRMVCRIAYGDPPTTEHHARHLCGKGHLGCFNADCLAWGTAKDNHNDAVSHGTWTRGEHVGTSKLTERQAREIHKAKGVVRQVDLAAQYGVSQSLISAIQMRTWWKHAL